MIEETLGQQLQRELAGADFDASRRIVIQNSKPRDGERAQRRLHEITQEQLRKEAEIAGGVAVRGSETSEENK